MSQPASAVAPLDPRLFPRIGEVDDRFQSYNVEMVEVIGGRFWKPYGGKADERADGRAPVERSSGVPVGMDPDIYQYRPPIDLGNARLRTLAAALGPAYVRVSGTWANSVYFHDADTPAPQSPPGRVRRRTDPAAMAGRRRLRRSGRRQDRHLGRHRRRCPGRGRRVEHRIRRRRCSTSPVPPGARSPRPSS